jgi:hypothetical protein
MRDTETIGADTTSASVKPNRTVLGLSALIGFGLAFFLGVRVAPKFQSGPDNFVPREVAGDVGRARSLNANVRRLEAEGVMIRPHVRDALEASLWWLERRPDLQAAFGKPEQVDIGALLGFVSSVNDATAVSMVPYRPGLAELRGRMGILDARESDVHNVLFWGFANRRRPQIDTDPVITRLAAVWLTRPELHEQFLLNGRLQLRPFVFWAATVSSDDPSYELLVPITYQLEQVFAELQSAGVDR